MICFPNAKINFGLDIISKRNDGYHNISSVLYPIPFYDVLEFFPSKTYKLRTFGLKIEVPESENLVTKAWKLINRLYNIPAVEIKLLKQIPFGSGLGGGSADAAFLIKNLNDFFKLDLSIEELEKLALQIGSDCPFFIQNKPAFIQGRGETIEAANLSLIDKYIVLVLPDIQTSTANAYSIAMPSIPDKSIKQIIQYPIENWSKCLKNDFETTLTATHPELKKIKQTLYHKGACYASLSGSGSAYYGVFDENPELKKEDIGYPVLIFKM